MAPKNILLIIAIIGTVALAGLLPTSFGKSHAALLWILILLISIGSLATVIAAKIRGNSS